MKRQRTPLAVRFWGKVSKRGSDECWPWLGAKTLYGYGHISNDDRTRTLIASRVSWELHNGPIPDGVNVLHKCDNPPCVNPGHLFLGTQQANVADMDAKGRRRSVSNPKFGEAHYRAILAESQVIEIRRRLKAGERARDIARDFDVLPGTITVIRQGITWKHVGDAAPIRQNLPALRGASNGNSKLTEDEARAIKARLRAGVRQADIAEEFDISPATVSHISIGRLWSWLT